MVHKVFEQDSAHNGKSAAREWHISLFVSSDCERCDRAQRYLEAWVSWHTDVVLEIVSVLERPEDVVRLGIHFTPALVINRALIAENVSLQMLVEHLEPLERHNIDPER